MNPLTTSFWHDLNLSTREFDRFVCSEAKNSKHSTNPKNHLKSTKTSYSRLCNILNANSYEFLELRFDFANLQFIPTAFILLSLRALCMSDKIRGKFPVVYIWRLYFTTFTTMLKLAAWQNQFYRTSFIKLDAARWSASNNN